MTAPVPLVGRDDVLSALAGVLADARAGRGSLVVLTGEPGIGKTRAAEEIVRRADGFAVQWAWCTAEASTGSLLPWAQVLRALTAGHTAVAELVTASSLLSALVAGREGTGEDPALTRSLLGVDLAAAVRLAAAATPQLIVLDDLHDAQASTLRVLADLAGTLRTARVVIVATARDAAADWTGRERLRGDLLNQARRLALGPLGEQDVQALLGPGHDPAAARALLSRTGGNALLVTEMARSPDPGQVPASLQAIVAARLDRLDPGCRDAMAAASVLGPRFRLDVLSDTTGGELGTLSAQLAQATAAALAVPTGPGEARFVHELLRDAVYSGLDVAERQRWHGRAGNALARHLSRGRSVEPAEVAHHLLRAGPELAATAGDLAAAAARRAAGLGAFDDAVRWFDAALATADDPTELLLESARARRGTGDTDGARAAILLAGATATTPELLARAALALGTGAGGFEVDAADGRQLELLERALASLPDDALAQRAAVTARLSVATSLTTTVAARQQRAEEAVRLGRLSGDPAALAGALASLCDAVAGPDDVGRRLDLSSEIVELAVAARDGDLELLGRRLRLVALLETGDRSAAEREAKAYQLRAEAVRHPLYLWYVPLWQGLWALAEGRYDDCRACTEEVERIGAGSENAFLLAVTQRFCLLGQRGDTAGLDALFAVNDPQQFGQPWGAVAAALALVQCGRPDEARACFAPVAGLVLDLPRDAEWLPVMAQVCLVIEGIGGHPLAPELYAALSPYASLFVIEGIGAAVRGSVSRFLALLAPDAADRARHRAADEQACRAIGAVALLPRNDVGALSGPLAAWQRDGDTWALRFHGRETRLRDSKGMQDLARLLAAAGREVAALDLYAVDAPLEADTGEVVDAAAREAYTRRLRDLEGQELSEREAEEREWLLAQLTAAYGLGGRARRSGSSVERARSAVTARVRDAVRRVAVHDPDLGRHLTHAVRTGTFCSYVPETPVDWDLTL